MALAAAKGVQYARRGTHRPLAAVLGRTMCSMMMFLPLALLPVSMALLHASSHPGPPGRRSTSFLSFDAFVSTFGRGYKSGSAEYERRRTIFERRREEAAAQNRDADRSWTAGMNHLSDWTEGELKRLRGYTGLGRQQHRGTALLSSSQHKEHAVVLHNQSSSSIHMRGSSFRRGGLSDLPAEKSWKHLQAMQRIRDQGSCGSCWALAARAILEAYVEQEGAGEPGSQLSVQELLACTPNPKRCGGDGGCRGATIDLALDYAIGAGLASERTWPYQPDIAQSQARKCGAPADSSGVDTILQQQLQRQKKKRNQNIGHEEGEETTTSSRHDLAVRRELSAKFGTYAMLPKNGYEDLMRALLDGPVGVSVAGGLWQSYHSGIFDKCDGDAEGAVVDHAVVLVAYGAQASRKYWTLMNSWGPNWGEDGYIRLLRRDDDGDRCRQDAKPELGTACKPYPDQVTVCGQCGILYESVMLKH